MLTSIVYFIGQIHSLLCLWFYMKTKFINLFATMIIFNTGKYQWSYDVKFSTIKLNPADVTIISITSIDFSNCELWGDLWPKLKVGYVFTEFSENLSISVEISLAAPCDNSAIKSSVNNLAGIMIWRVQ